MKPIIHRRTQNLLLVICGVDYESRDLGRIDVSNEDLREANLRGYDFKGSDLSETDLRGADLTGADLSDAILFGANLNGANLQSTVLSGSLFDDSTTWSDGFNPFDHGAILIPRFLPSERDRSKFRSVILVSR